MTGEREQALLAQVAQLRAQVADGAAREDALQKQIDALQKQLDHRTAWPNNLEAEKYVLGGVLFDAQRTLPAVASLQPGDFYLSVHQAIWAAILDLDRLSRPIDIITLVEQMRVTETYGKLAAYNGEAYPAELVNGAWSPMDAIGWHARHVRDKSVLRRLIRAAHDVVALCLAADAPADEVASEAVRLVMEATADVGVEAMPARPLVDAAVKRLEARHEKKAQIRGIPTDLPVDAMLGGLHPGQLVVVAAETGRGKTSLATQIAVAGQVPALLFSLEMSADELMDRIICQTGRIDGHNFHVLGTLTKQEWFSLSVASEKLAEGPMWFIDALTTIEAVRSAARRWHARHVVAKKLTHALVVVDYLQLIEGRGGKSQGRNPANREQEVAMISRLLKILALQTGCVVVALSQLNEEGQLRESRAIGQNADVVFVLEANADNPDLVDLVVRKNRRGRTGRIPLLWQGQYTRFEAP